MPVLNSIRNCFIMFPLHIKVRDQTTKYLSVQASWNILILYFYEFRLDWSSCLGHLLGCPVPPSRPGQSTLLLRFVSLCACSTSTGNTSMTGIAPVDACARIWGQDNMGDKIIYYCTNSTKFHNTLYMKKADFMAKRYHVLSDYSRFLQTMQKMYEEQNKIH